MVRASSPSRTRCIEIILIVSELANALEEFDRDDEIRCIVLTGAGERAFAAGADIKEMSDKSPIDMLLGGFENWNRIRRIKKPLIATVGWLCPGRRLRTGDAL